MKYIYLDYNATTPLEDEVLEAMLPYLKNNYGNPSSGHWYGREAKKAVEESREKVAALIGASPEEIVFTGGGSESNNLALKGVLYANWPKGKHLVTSVIEHPAIMKPAGHLQEIGYEVSYVPCDEYGVVHPGRVARAITNSTVLVSIMYANNEVGTIQPIKEIGKSVRVRGVYFHSDASQAVGKIPVRVDEANVDLLTLCAHKFCGPKGVGALFIRKGTVIESFIHGSGHESGRRAGTENVAGVVGMATAGEIAQRTMKDESERITRLRDYFYYRLKSEIRGLVLNGHPEMRLPNTLHVSFEEISGTDLLNRIPEICATTGAACADRAEQLSGVMKAMGVKEDIGLGSVRFSLGRRTTREELDRAVQLIKEALEGSKQQVGS
ncbi:MAG: cysteine desulfurase family protein [Eubacteriales bacterium]